MKTLEQSHTCPTCGKRALKRNETTYRIAMIFFGTFWMVSMLLERNETIGTAILGASSLWIVWPRNILVIFFVISLLTFGYHELFDPVRTYTCKKCGENVTRPRKPLTWLQKGFFIFLAVSLGVFAILLIVLTRV